MNYDKQAGRTNYKQLQIIKIKNQIRAQLNNLRRTYHNTQSINQKKYPKKKHFPQKLCQQTLKQPQKNQTDAEKSRSKSIGKRKISPINTPDPHGFVLQKRHYPLKYIDNVQLKFNKFRHSSSYYNLKQNNSSPQKPQKSILSFVDQKQLVRQKSSKRIIPSMHIFTQEFF